MRKLVDRQKYDMSEEIAWNSADLLRSVLVDLNGQYPGDVSVLAHSMGNIVTSEALRLQADVYHGGQLVKTYVRVMHLRSGTHMKPSFHE